MKHTHTFVKIPPLFWVHKSAAQYMLQCDKCKIYTFVSRYFATKFLNLYIKEIKERRKNKDNYLSLKRELSFSNSYYIKNGFIYKINYKQQIINKIGCVMSDDDFLAQEILQ